MNKNNTDPLRSQIYESMELKSTEELLEIWRTGNHAEWTDTALEIVKEILLFRLGKIPSKEELSSMEATKISTVNIQNNVDKFSTTKLKDGSLSGKVSDPQSKQASAYQLAYGVVYLIGVISFVFGLITVLFYTNIFGNANYLIIAGLLFVGLGFFIKRKSVLALYVAIAIYAIDGIVSIISLIVQSNFLVIGFITMRILFLTPMIQGISAITAIKRKDKKGGNLPEAILPAQSGSSRQISSVELWFLWIMTSVLASFGWSLVYPLINPTYDKSLYTMAYTLSSVSSGIIAGLLQWILLMQIIPKAKRQTLVFWIPATIFGWTIGPIINSFVESPDEISLLISAISGLTIGLLQWIVLQKYSKEALWWIPVSIIDWMAVSVFSHLHIVENISDVVVIYFLLGVVGSIASSIGIIYILKEKWSVSNNTK